jgi:hypothetical protein
MKKIIMNETRKVHEVLADFSNISEANARKICEDFTRVGFELPADDLASKHYVMIVDLHEALESPDIREAMLRGEEEVSYADDSADDPFFYSVKIPEEQVDSYLIPHNGTYYCSICSTDINNGGVKLSCGSADNKKNCQSVYCRECIIGWITKCCARCPVCRKFVSHVKVESEVKEVEKNTKKKKIVITIKKKGSKAVE